MGETLQEKNSGYVFRYWPIGCEVVVVGGVCHVVCIVCMGVVEPICQLFK